MNAYVERFVQTIQQECLDKFIAFSQEHPDPLTGEFLEHYHHERPHQGKRIAPLISSSKLSSPDGEIAPRTTGRGAEALLSGGGVGRH